MMYARFAMGLQRPGGDIDDNTDKLVWKWLKGQATSQAELSNPTTTADYALCVYNANGLLLSAQVPADVTKWSVLNDDKGFTYSDAAGTEAGITNMLLKSHASADKAKALVKGKGDHLSDPTLGNLPLPITAQLRNQETGICLEGVYDSSDVIMNDSSQFKAKAQ